MSEPHDRAEYPITPHDVWQVLRDVVELIGVYDHNAVEEAMTHIAHMDQLAWDATGYHVDVKRQLARIARARAREEAGGDGR